MKCEIIRDLLPSYCDGICSNETAELVEEHLKTCSVCNGILEMMKQQEEFETVISKADNIRAKKPFARIKRKQMLHIGIAVVLTVFIMAAGYQVVQNVGPIHDTLFPQKNVIVLATETIGTWERVEIEGEEYLEFGSFLYKRCITNHANSEDTAILRVKDVDGNIIMDSIELAPGESKSLKELETDQKYVLEIKGSEERVFLTIY